LAIAHEPKRKVIDRVGAELISSRPDCSYRNNSTLIGPDIFEPIEVIVFDQI
jgi:hypothetical protein